ncbi:cell division topological specificity factor MinE [Moraxella sp. FZFQ2102]|uniref:cell division topological specificity factor MinE n=1 Tax=Moraxella sp. FZFQ2102 TaxID=2953752 RepID=UPI00209C031F|nr:cell division topological specificity factor MinE [Moraxella sp. FZFQ2102]USZ15842.1 cell division topological specificity factor MinE [Moraxella sp. FZFQ2102]
MKKGFWSSLFGGGTSSQSSADIAKDRLKVIVASHDRLNTRLTAERIEQMKREILAVVGKYVNGVNIDDLNINHRHEDSVDVLEMNISLPDRKSA